MTTIRPTTNHEEQRDRLYREHRHDRCPGCGSVDNAITLRGVTCTVICGECDHVIDEFDIDDPADEQWVYY